MLPSPVNYKQCSQHSSCKYKCNHVSDQLRHVMKWNYSASDHLEIWHHLWASAYLCRRLTFWWLDHLFSELLKCTQHFLEISWYCLHGSSECVVDHSKPLVMTYRMNEHNKLLFHRGVAAIYQQSTLHKPSKKCKEWGSIHLEHVECLYIVIIENAVQITYPL
jgi:hypothetical protein